MSGVHLFSQSNGTRSRSQQSHNDQTRGPEREHQIYELAIMSFSFMTVYVFVSCFIRMGKTKSHFIWQWPSLGQLSQNPLGRMDLWVAKYQLIPVSHNPCKVGFCFHILYRNTTKFCKSSTFDEMFELAKDTLDPTVFRPTSELEWWRHQMETFSALLALCAGNSPVPVNSPHKGQWRGALMFSLICVWINVWENNREAGDLRRHRGHYDVNVMGVGVSSLAQSQSLRCPNFVSNKSMLFSFKSMASTVGCIHQRDINLTMTLLGKVLAPKGTKASASTLMAPELYVFSSNFHD